VVVTREDVVVPSEAVVEPERAADARLTEAEPVTVG
jgi:hypothetical protein